MTEVYNMRIFEVDCTSVILSGVILSGHLTLHNPHQMLAVIFEVECSPPFLEIEPIRGMIMQKDTKIIKMRCKNEARPSLAKIQRGLKQLIVRGSYHSEYNKKIMAKNNLTGWSVISKQLQEIPIPIHFNLADQIQKAKEEAHRSSSLRNSRKMNSFQKFRESSIKRTKNERLNEDLDFIFRNQQFKKAYESKHSFKPPPEQQQRKTKTTPQFFQRPRHDNEDFASPLLSPIKMEMSESRPKQSNSPAIKRAEEKARQVSGVNKGQRGVDLMILAIIAALFLGLGEGMGQQFKS